MSERLLRTLIPSWPRPLHPLQAQGSGDGAGLFACRACSTDLQSTAAMKTSTTVGGEHSAPGRTSICTPGAIIAHGLPFGEAAAGEAAPWRTLVAASADYVPAGAPPALVTKVAAATIARPFNSDIACEVSLAGMAMILEHHGVSSGNQGLVGDLVEFLTTMARQRQMGA